MISLSRPRVNPPRAPRCSHFLRPAAWATPPQRLLSVSMWRGDFLGPPPGGAGPPRPPPLTTPFFGPPPPPAPAPLSLVWRGGPARRPRAAPAEVGRTLTPAA